MSRELLKAERLRRQVENIATLSTCPRRSVGAIIVRDGRVILEGYNGSPPGEPHCIDEGCDMEGTHCVRAAHAEENAIAHAARFGIATEGADLYVSVKPCRRCSRMIKSAGIRNVTYYEEYP